MTNVKQTLGKYGEWLAGEHLIEAGMKLVDRNWRCSLGEIDIIAWDGEVLVFCEVKTRRGAGFGTPAEAVVAAKSRRLRNLAAHWLVTKGVRAPEVRFDVVSVLSGRHGPPSIEHIKGAF